MRHIFSRKSRRNPDAPDPLAIIAKTTEQAIQAVDEIASGLSADVRQADASFLEWYWQQLGYHFNVAQALAVVTRQATAPSPQRPLTQDHDPAVPEYFISSRFLIECYRFLTADPRGFERLHLVTGIALDGNRFTLEQMEKVPMSHQSHTGAQADQHAFTRALIALTESGHALHAIFHSHPGFGPRATLPSTDKDLPTHQRLEEGGYPLIGAIFVKDSYVRFFSTNRPFTVTIYGTGVVQHDTNVFKIQNIPTHPISYEAFETEE